MLKRAQRVARVGEWDKIVERFPVSKGIFPPLEKVLGFFFCNKLFHQSLENPRHHVQISTCKLCRSNRITLSESSAKDHILAGAFITSVHFHVVIIGHQR